jgi:hypothetical protein
MLAGADNKVKSLDSVIKNAEKQGVKLKTGMARAMGIGSENSGKDMLRGGGARATERA